jgi:ATP-binding cassette subfamily B protein
MGYYTVFDVRAAVYEKLQELSLSYFDRHQTGAILARVNQDTAELQRFMVDFIPLSAESFLTLIGVGVFLFILSWKLTIFVLIPISGIIFYVRRIMPRIRVTFSRFFHRRARLSALVNDSLSGIRVIKSFGQEDEEIKKFDRRSGQYRDAGVDVAVKWAIYHPIFHFFILLGSVLVWYIGGKFVVGGTMTLGSVVAYSGYLMMFYRPISTLTRMIQWITNSLIAAERVFDVIDTEAEIQDAATAVDMPRLEGRIEFRNVTFGYNRFKPVIKDMTFTVQPNEIVGLVGKSGAGKSTIINLFCRLYDVNRGTILIDGVDVRRIRYTDLRRQIGVVLQETFLFNGTIFENIAYARPEATREDVIAAAITANAHEFIMRKPDGYDTEVGERGNSLSGGEKQRISIARAILRDPRILILDEATSSVDTETESHIQQALEKLMQGRTTVTIAHRLSTLRNSHRLFVIDEGKLVEEGTHSELIEKKGLFTKLVDMQQELSRIIAVDG